MTQEERRQRITRSQTQRGFIPQQQGYYPGSQLSPYGQPLIQQVPLVPQRQTPQTNVERLRIFLQKDLIKPPTKKEIFMTIYNTISEEDFKVKISAIFFKLLNSYIANKSLNINDIHTIIQNQTTSRQANKYFNPGKTSEGDYIDRGGHTRKSNAYNKFLQKIQSLFEIAGLQTDTTTTTTKSEMTDMINLLVDDVIQRGRISFKRQRGGATIITPGPALFNKDTELTDNIAFDKEFIQNLPKKYIQIIDNMYANIEERYKLLAENVFKKHFINRKTAIKAEELINILQPIIVEKND